MRLVIDQKQLKPALAKMKSVVDTKSYNAILHNVKMTTKGKTQVVLTANDLDRSLEITLGADVTEKGSYLLDYKKLCKAIAAMKGDVSLESADDSLASEISVFSNPKRRVKLLGLASDEFPALPAGFKTGHAFDTSMLTGMINSVAYAQSADETRPHINGLLIEQKNNRFLTCSTDGHRLAQNIMKHKCPDFTIIPKSSSISTLLKLLDVPGDVGMSQGSAGVVRFSGSTMLLKKPAQTAKFVFYARETGSEFPPKDQIIPKKFDACFNMDRAELKKNSDWICKLTDKNSLGTTLKFDAGTLNMTSNDVECDMSYSDNDAILEPIGVNLGYIQECLAHQFKGCDNVEMCLGAPLDPIVIRNEEQDSLVVVMPMRI